MHQQDDVLAEDGASVDESKKWAHVAVTTNRREEWALELQVGGSTQFMLSLVSHRPPARTTVLVPAADTDPRAVELDEEGVLHHRQVWQLEVDGPAFVVDPGKAASVDTAVEALNEKLVEYGADGTLADTNSPAYPAIKIHTVMFGAVDCTEPSKEGNCLPVVELYYRPESLRQRNKRRIAF